MRPSSPSSGLLWRLTSIPLRFKITFPYLILSILLALVATYLVSQGFAQTLQTRFEGQLVDSANRVNDRLFSIQETQLSQVRTIARTEGVAEAVEQGDVTALGSKVLGLALNDRIPLIEILDANGRTIYSLHLDPASLAHRDDPPGDFVNLPFVQRVLQREVDSLGDKYAGWATTPWGHSMYTAGPILLGDKLVGVALVGIPIDALTHELDQAALARIVLYNPDGQVTYSTLSREVGAGIPLGADLLTKLAQGGGRIPTRLMDVNDRPFVEAITPIYMRGVDSGWRVSVALAEALVTDASGPTLQQLIAVFSVAILAIVGLGVVVAQLVAAPVFRLVTATGEVAAGHLDVQVPIMAEDEIGVLTQRFNQMVSTLKQREVMRELFGRMVSEEVREAVLEGHINLGGEVMTVSVLFSDIRAFTTLSEQFEPEEVVAFLNAYFSNVTGVVYDYGGIINRYAGDSTLAIFGAPVPLPQEDSSRRALRAALAMRRRLLEFNAQRMAGNLAPVEIGIGINTGEVVTGNIGSAERFEYTVIGDTVNITARVQELCKRFPEHSLIITQAAFDALPDRADYQTVDLGEVTIRGRHDPVRVIAIEGLRPVGEICVSWARERGLRYRDLIEALYLHARGYPNDLIAKLKGFSLGSVTADLMFYRTEAKLLARHIAREFELDETMVLNAMLPGLSKPETAAPTEPRSSARRHRPGPPLSSRAVSALRRRAPRGGFTTLSSQ